jgi:uncharacterized protein (DUF697 family)
MALHPGTILGLAKELRLARSDERSLVVTGTLADQLARELGRDASPGAVRTGGTLETAAALVYVLSGEPDVELLRTADRGDVPIVCVRLEGSGDVPYVLATDVIEVERGAGFPLDAIAEVLAARLGEKGVNVARRVPVLREAVARHLVSSFSLRGAWTAGAWFLPGGEGVPLTIRQVRLVVRIAHLYGHEVDAKLAPEVAAVVASGNGFRAVARRLLLRAPLPGFAIRGGIAYAGTRAIGEAAVARFRRPPASAASAAP